MTSKSGAATLHSKTLAHGFVAQNSNSIVTFAAKETTTFRRYPQKRRFLTKKMKKVLTHFWRFG
jgi:hypothetical protein